jgi:lactate permease
VSGLEASADQEGEHPEMSAGKAWVPYLMLAVLLVLSRLRELPWFDSHPELWFGNLLRSFTIEWVEIFGTSVTAVTTPLYLPGTLLIAVVGITALLHRMSGAALKRAFVDSSRVLLGAGFVLVFTVPMVRVYINSGVNAAGLESMPLEMAGWVANTVGGVWPLFAGVTGALGAFIAGSNTVSNLMFAAFQHGVAARLAISSSMIVALQAVGAAAGNMIAIHNVVAASATVGLLGREGATLRKTILPTIYYLTVIGVLGLIAIYVLRISGPLWAG